MIRVSIEIGRGLPSRSIWRSSSTRRSLTCTSAGRSPISSRKIVEWSASSNLPTWRDSAPVNAPFSRPNNSLSMSVAGIAPQLTRTIVRPLAASELVDLRCEEFLAGSRFSEQEHRGVGARYLPDLLHYPPDGRALSDDAGQPQALSLFQTQVDVLGVQPIFEPLHFTRRREHRLVPLLPRQDLLEHAREDFEAMHDAPAASFARRGPW